MTSPIVLGQNRAVEQPKQRAKKMGSPISETRSWRGSRAVIEEMLNHPLFSYASNVKVSGSGATRTLTADFTWDTSSGSGGGPQNEKPSVRWELDWEALAKPLETFKDFAELGAALLREFNKVIATGDEAEVSAYLDEYPADTPEGDFLRLKLQGTDSYEDYAYIIRKTTAFGVNSQVRATFEGVNKVTTIFGGTVFAFNSSTLSNPEDPLAKAAFTLPDGDYKKSPPKLVDRGGGKFDIVEEWRWAEVWSSRLYSNNNAELAQKAALKKTEAKKLWLAKREARKLAYAKVRKSARRMKPKVTK